MRAAELNPNVSLAVFEAASNGVSPRRFAKLRSAPKRRSFATVWRKSMMIYKLKGRAADCSFTSKSLLAKEMCRGVFPRLSLKLGFALFSRSQVVTVEFRASIERWRGELP